MKLSVKSVKSENENVLSLLFDKPKGFQFYPAQFIDVQVDITNPDNSRIYSLSSSPTEDSLMITFKKGISDHKKKLQTLEAGDEVTITHPNGTYTLDESSPAIMLAGGVGIAPHRSMIKWAVDRKLDLPITLIYSNSDEDFIFKKELDKWQQIHPKLNIKYVVTSKTGRPNKVSLKKLLTSHFSLLTSIYYLAGPPNFVSDIEQILKDFVDSVNIRLDSFDGY